MSGHSKWSTIKHKKAKTDSLRAAEFQKFSREIITLDSDVNIYQDSRYYDAKSILTIFSLNMNQKHYIEIISDNEYEIRKFNEIAEEYK